VSRLEHIGFRGGSAYREVLSWAIESIAQEQKAKRLGEFEWSIILGNILGLRSKLGTIYDYIDQQIPFSYVTLMSSTIFAYLLIFSVSVAYSYELPGPKPFMTADSIIEYVYVLFFSVLLLGLRWLAFRLQDPFGNYDEDLSIIHYVRFTTTASCRLLTEKKMPLSTEEEERELCFERGVQYDDEDEEDGEEGERVAAALSTRSEERELST
jgi:predicted membrane chloride channel (bestrophin family)